MSLESPSSRRFLDAATELAARGLYSTPPNPRVGCVIVRDGVIVGRGWHVRAGEGHAEVNALADAGGHARGATAYVSLEPCCHTGRTPPCADALVAAGIRRVVAASRDPDPRVAGRGFERLKAAGIEVECAGVDDARRLNPGHWQRAERGLPWVRIKLAASLDGRTAMASGESRWITGAAARADVQRLRARSCAVVTGIGTVLADDPRLTVRDASCAVDGRIRQPLRVVLDSEQRIHAAAAIFETPGVLLVTESNEAPPRADAEVLRLARVTPANVLHALAARGLTEILVEAGATLAGSFLTANAWDEAILYLAPKILGPTARPLADVAVERLGDALGGSVAALDRIGEDIRLVLTNGKRWDTA